MRRDEGEVTVDNDGQTYRARWKVERGMVTVWPNDGAGTSTQLGDSPPEFIARMILTEYLNGAR